MKRHFWKLLFFLVVVFGYSCSDENEVQNLNQNNGSIQLMLPADGTDGVDIAPTFEWKPVDLTDNYVYELRIGADSTQLAVAAENLTVTEFTLNDFLLMKQDLFYWQVLAIGEGQVVKSPIWSLSTIPSINAPVLTDAGYNKYIRDVVSVSWEEVQGGVGEDIYYELYFDENNPPKTKVATTSDLSIDYDVSNLEVGKDYYYSIRSTDLISGKMSSKVLQAKKLSIGAPDIPLVISPQNYHGVVGNTTTLSWEGCPDPENDPVTYDVYFGDNYPATELIASGISETMLDVDGLVLSKPKYWKVVAKDPNGHTTSSKDLRFTVMVDGAPNPPALADIALDGILKLDDVFSWEDSQGAASYDIYMDESDDPTTLIASNLTETEFVVPNSEMYATILDAPTYRLVVAAKSATGEITRSVPVIFQPQVEGIYVDPRDNEEYTWVRFGEQVWMSQNYRTTQFADGVDIEDVEQTKLITKSNHQLFYDEHPKKSDWSGWQDDWIQTKGRVYSWGVVGHDKIAPEGWHVMVDSDWKYVKGVLKETKKFHGTWQEGGEDTYGLNYESAGWRYDNHQSDATYIDGFRYSLEQTRSDLWVNDGKYGVLELKSNASKPNDWRKFSYSSAMMFGIRLVRNDK